MAREDKGRGPSPAITDSAGVGFALHASCMAGQKRKLHAEPAHPERGPELKTTRPDSFDRLPRKSGWAAVSVAALLCVAPAGCESAPSVAAPRPATAAPATAAPATAAPATAAPATAAPPTAAANLGPAPAPKALAAMLPPYLIIQDALAGDTLAGVAGAAKQLAEAARAAGHPAVADAAGPLGGADLAAVRQAFKQISNPMAEWSLADPAAKAKYVVVHCPMAPGSWVQKDRKVRNPYYGKDMLECGTLKN